MPSSTYPAAHTRQLWHALRWAAAPTEWEPLTGRAMAERLGISETRASRYKTGRQPMTLEDLVRFCQALGLAVGAVLERAGLAGGTAEASSAMQ